VKAKAYVVVWAVMRFRKTMPISFAIRLTEVIRRPRLVAISYASRRRFAKFANLCFSAFVHCFGCVRFMDQNIRIAHCTVTPCRR